MNKFLPILFAAIIPVGLIAQTYSPSATDGIPGGSIGNSYSQDIAVSIPTDVDIDLSLIPGLPTLPGLPGLPSLASMSVTTTTLSVDGLPLGLNATCSPNCTFSGGSSGTITISGTPSEPGDFSVDITSTTIGVADMSGLISALELLNVGGALDAILSQIPTNIPVPSVPGIMDEGTYNMFVADPNGIQDLDPKTFGLTFLGEHPFRGKTEMAVSVPTASKVDFEIIDINGRSADRFSINAVQGINKITLAPEVESGTYFLKSTFQGEQKLTRFMVID